MISDAELRRNIRRLRQKQDDDIAQFGRTLVGVFPVEGSADPVNRSFVYTMGNSLRGLPELLIVGLWNDRGILNGLSDEMIRLGRAFEEGETFTFPGSAAPLAFVNAADEVKDRYTSQASDRFGRDAYRVVQVVLSDKNGRLPWQSGCAKPYSDVVVWRANKIN